MQIKTLCAANLLFYSYNLTTILQGIYNLQRVIYSCYYFIQMSNLFAFQTVKKQYSYVSQIEANSKMGLTNKL